MSYNLIAVLIGFGLVVSWLALIIWHAGYVSGRREREMKQFERDMRDRR